MAATVAAPPPPSKTRPSDADQFAAIVKSIERGEPADIDRIVPLAQSTDRATRGLAKRLLAVVLVDRARQDAGQLLQEACADLDYAYPAVIQEALQHAESLRRFDRVFEIRLQAAHAGARRRQHVPALVHLLNAAAIDFRNGARHINDPAWLRRAIHVYEQIASQAAADCGIRPSPRGVRRTADGQRLRMAHVVCQLVDGNHSPSMCVDTMLKFADRERFDTFMVVTESLAVHGEHQGQAVGSGWSTERAATLIRRFENDLGVPVIVPKSRGSFLSAAAELHARMAEMKIDVAFFHGSIATPTDWLLCAWRCAPWQFDRAFGVPLHCPAVDYQFFEFEESMENLAFWCRERNVPFGHSPFGGVDYSDSANAPPLDKQELGVPADHVILGTIGNHLPVRMSEPFCRTVAGVLRNHPRCTYLIVGPGDFAAQRAAFGPDLCGGNGAPPRVRFVGPTDRTDRMTQTFDIYLNQYPAGGGASVLEAMAASKPVLSMRIGDSFLSLAGAIYVGDRLIEPATDEAYAACLARVITSPAERAEFGRAMQQRYQSEFNGRKWTADMTNRIWDFIHCHTGRP